MQGGILLRHVKALIIKFIASFALLYIVLGVVYDMSIGTVFVITMLVGVSSYLLGDMLILPRSNNTIATIADIGLSFFLIWYIGSVLTDGNMFYPSLISAIGIGLFEFVFHKYVLNHVFKNEDVSGDVSIGNYRYQTEASEELTPEFKNEKTYKKKNKRKTKK